MSQFDSSNFSSLPTDSKEVTKAKAQLSGASRSEHRGETSLELLVGPKSYSFSSAEGEPTLVTISRSSDSRQQIARDTHFYAVQNIGGCRHTLDIHLVEFEIGHFSLRGELRELGRNRLLSGPQNREPDPILLSFLMHASDADAGEKHALQMMAQTFLESFADQGALGVFDRLTRTRRSTNSANHWVLVGPAFERELIHQKRELTGGVEQPPPFEVSTGDISRSNFSAREMRILDQLEESLILVRNLCNDELLRSEYEREPVTQISSENDESAPNTIEDDSRFFSVSRKYIFGKLRGNFFSSRENIASQTIVTLKLPIGLRPKDSDLSNLTIEVAGPRGFLLLREVYTVKDNNNLLSISPFGNNDEFFRNLFRTLHAANQDLLPPHKKVEEVLRLLDAYKLKAAPCNLPAMIGTLWRRYVIPAITQRQNERVNKDDRIQNS